MSFAQLIVFTIVGIFVVIVIGVPSAFILIYLNRKARKLFEKE